ncbi:MAG TPA: CoA-binding protein, partial [Candidatus Gracilibacteria bacterium]|nr:CoA-binding protein [Candidatus Gracilibacteria bacterium]
MSLQQVFFPKSIAVVGASTKPGSVGNDIVKNLIGQFSGAIYPVNPKATEIYETPCYASLEEISAPIELVIVVVPAAAVPDVLLSAGQKGAKAAIIISAGFK